MNTTAQTTTLPSGFEYLQYNDELRLIHCLEDDTYNASSMIVELTKDRKKPKHFSEWLENKGTKSLLKGFMRGLEISTSNNLYKLRDDLPNNFRGYYVHRLLINEIASWASPLYAYKVALILDNYFEQQRKQTQEQIAQSQEQVKQLKPRAVPESTEYDFKYMLYEQDSKDGFMTINMIRRNRRTWTKEFKAKASSPECLLVSEFLPIATSINIMIKKEIKNRFGKNDYRFHQSSITIKDEYVKDLINIANQFISDYKNN